MYIYSTVIFFYRGFTIGADNVATIPLNTLVAGDVTIIVYHARSTFGGKVQGKVSNLLFILKIITDFVKYFFNQIGRFLETMSVPPPSKVLNPYLKGTPTVCFRISYYNVNQILIFIVKPQGLHVLLGGFVAMNLLAHLWGAYAVTLALFVVRRESSVVCRLCPP